MSNGIIPFPMKPNGGGELPSGYTRLAYLESSGCKQYIDTKIVPELDCIITGEAMFVNAGALSTVYWSREGSNIYYPTFGLLAASKSGSNVVLRCYHWMRGSSSEGIYNIGLQDNTRFSFTCNHNEFYINGAGTQLDTQLSGKPVTSIGLFSLRQEGQWYPLTTPSDSSYVRVFAFTVMDKNGKTQLNFIPALDPSGRPCMYDTVTKKPFYNQGTGEFKYA